MDDKQNVRAEALYRSVISHFIGIIYAIAEFHLGYKPDLRAVDRRPRDRVK